MGDLSRLAARFEIAVGNFIRSAYSLSANEKAFQAWFAASVIQEFGLSRVYREVHLSKRQLIGLVGAEAMAGFAEGNELFPDLSVSWKEAVDTRHTRARSGDLDAAGIAQFGILSEFKVTSSTAKPTPPAAIGKDLRKLGVLGLARARCGHPGELATYMVILDNHCTPVGSPTSRYEPRRMARLLDTSGE